MVHVQQRSLNRKMERRSTAGGMLDWVQQKERHPERERDIQQTERNHELKHPSQITDQGPVDLTCKSRESWGTTWKWTSHSSKCRNQDTIKGWRRKRRNVALFTVFKNLKNNLIKQLGKENWRMEYKSPWRSCCWLWYVFSKMGQAGEWELRGVGVCSSRRQYN